MRSIDSRVVFYFLLIKLNVQFQNIITKETIRLQNDLESEFIYQQLLSDIITEVLKTSKFSRVICGFSDGICEFVDWIQWHIKFCRQIREFWSVNSYNISTKNK